MDVRQYITPVEEAIGEIQKRRADPVLVRRVEEYLDGDIPEHFNGLDPVLYLCRHVATPNHETLRFVEKNKQFGLPVIIGQDTKDKFVSNNSLKRALGRMSIVKEISKRGNEVTENFTVVNFNKYQGNPLEQVRTRTKEPIVKFHNDLFHKVCPNTVKIIDESDWVDRHHRGDLVAHYKQFLALLIAHGVMFEFYEPEDFEFVSTVLDPTFKEIERTFGCKPLICDLVRHGTEFDRDWNGYPPSVYPHIQEIFDKNGLQPSV